MYAGNFIGRDVLTRLDSLTVYRGILKDRVLKRFRRLCSDLAKKPMDGAVPVSYYPFVSALIHNAERLGLSGNIFKQYFIHLFLNDENIFSLACEQNIPEASSSLYRLAERDADMLAYCCGLDMAELFCTKGGGEFLCYSPLAKQEDPYLCEAEIRSDASGLLQTLIRRYNEAGAGDMARFNMFTVQRQGRLPIRLCGVTRADTVTLDSIVGFESQKQQLIQNTENFINGLPANNVLLAGSRGNGKSSCVKALANAYAAKGLRLIEIQKDQTLLLPDLMDRLSARGKYFIFFMDDLSYEQSETQYKYLKSLLEGGTETKPGNVLFYATSNRRHIVRESFGDRAEQPLSEDVHTTDTLNEKLSLFDRFGITITFPNLSQDEYIRVVKKLAAERGLDEDPAHLVKLAVKWALTQKSMSGRTARQFADYLAGHTFAHHE